MDAFRERSFALAEQKTPPCTMFYLALCEKRTTLPRKCYSFSVSDTDTSRLNCASGGPSSDKLSRLSTTSELNVKRGTLGDANPDALCCRHKTDNARFTKHRCQSVRAITRVSPPATQLSPLRSACPSDVSMRERSQRSALKTGFTEPAPSSLPFRTLKSMAASDSFRLSVSG